MSEDNNQEQKKIYNLYALFGVSLVLCVIPYVSAAILCIVFFTWLLIAAYIMRGKAEEHSLSDNHATFVIRTLWIGALFSLVTTIVASVYLYQNIDYSPVQSCVNNIVSQGIGSGDVSALIPLFEPCLNGFININYNAFVVAVIIAAMPPMAYLAYRFVRGLSRAIKGYRISDPKGWF